MSFELPRSPRSLRFTGSVKALAAPEPKPESPLGRMRPKTPPVARSIPASPSSRSASPPATLPPPAVPVRSPDVYAVEMQPTPYVGARPSERVEAADIAELFDEELETQALDRGELGIPAAAAPKAAAKASPNLPVPHFRSAQQVQAAARDPSRVVTQRTAARGGGPISMPIWVLVAIALGVISYHVVPHALSSGERTTGHLDSK